MSRSARSACSTAPGTTWTRADLARYRVVYAVVMLLCLPRFAWLDAWPDSLYDAPPGPFSLMDRFPGAGVLVALEIATALCLAALLVGAWVDIASVVLTIALLTGYGFTFSLGKIDHVVLVVLTPLFLAAAGWSGRREPAPWVLRLWAWTIGLALLSAGLAKVLAGWLDPTSQASYGDVVVYRLMGSPSLLGATVLHTSSPLAWEPLDVVTVALECGIVLLVLWWSGFRAGLAALAVFHLAVMLLLGIVFFGNVLVYAAFVHWGGFRLPRPAFPALVPRVSGIVTAGLALVVGLGTWVLCRVAGPATDVVGPLVVVAGGAAGLVFLGRLALRALSRG